MDPRVEELARLARIPEENPDPVLRISAEHLLVYHNSAAQELCRIWDCHLGQKAPAAIQALVSAALDQGGVVRREVVFGSHIYGLTATPSANHGVVNLYARDITEQKRTEEALRQAERTLRAIFDNTSDGIFLHDLQTRKCIMVNRSCLQMLGYTEEEFLTLHVADLHPETDLPFVEAQIQKFLQGGKPVRNDIPFQRKDGSVLFADVSPTLVRLDGVSYALVAMKDITQRKQMEEQLRQHAEHLEELVAARTGELRDSETRYRSLYHTIGDGIFVMGPQGQIEDVNDSACAQLGYTREELLGLPIAAISARADFHPEELLDRLRAAGSLSYETVHRRKDGTIIPVELSVTWIEYRGRPAALGVARDITERKRAQEALQFTQFAVDHAADAAFWMTEEGRFVYVNETACAALGYSREELLRMTVFDIDPVFTKNDWHRSWARLQVQKSDAFETLHKARDGRTYPVEIRVSYLEFAGRAYHCAFARDITERRQAEEALRRSQALYRDLVETSQDLIWQCDREGRYTYLNSAWETTFGYTLEEMLGKPFWTFQTPDYAERDRAEFGRLLQGGAATGYETVHRGKDGREIHLVFNAKFFQGPDGEIAGTRGAAYDVTERKRAEMTLRESEERFRAAFEEGAVGMALTALDSTLLKVNSAFCRMLGYSEADLVGRSYLEVTHPEDRAANLLGTQQLAAGTISSFRMQKRYIRRDGALVWGDMCTAAVHDGTGRPLYCVTHIQDITERKRAEEALRRWNEQLEQQVAQRTEDLRHTVHRLRELTLELSQAEDRERRRIADILHEDVQQTLAAAKFHLNLLGPEPRPPEEVREIVEQVKQMLKDAIEKSRSLSHELSPALYQVDLLEILNWLARQMQQKQGLTVRVEAPGPIECPSEPLKAFVYKVAQELLFNVVKHAEVNEARVRVRRLGQSLYLSVADRGRGFDPHNLETTIGFGLLGIRERVQLLGGRMRIKSRPGAGSKCLIVVPYETAARTDKPSPDPDRPRW